MSLSGLLRRKGAPAVFSITTPGAYDEATDRTSAPVTVTVPGKVMEIDGDPDLYKALELIETDSPTLLFTPDTIGQVPALGSTVPWRGETFTVRNLKRLAMAGVTTAARIVVTR